MSGPVQDLILLSCALAPHTVSKILPMIIVDALKLDFMGGDFAWAQGFFYY